MASIGVSHKSTYKFLAHPGEPGLDALAVSWFVLAFDLFRTTAETKFFPEPFQRGGQFSAMTATWIKGLAVSRLL